MAHLLEYRKVNEVYVPLYFKFSTISSKHNLTCDKFMSLESWMQISDELDPLLINGLEPNIPKKSKSFDVDHHRATVKARWSKISDSDVGNHILKILNLNPTSTSTSVSKYYLKIEIKLNSNFQRIVTDLEQKNQTLEEKIKPSCDSSRSVLNSSKQKKSKDRKISEMLPKIKKEEIDSSSPINDLCACNGSDAEDLYKVEEYIPDFVPGSFATNPMEAVPTYKPEKSSDMNEVQSEYEPTPVASLTHSTPIYNPEKNIAQIEINQIKSEYSPTPLSSSDKSLEEVVYKPMTKINKTSETEKSKKKSDKKSVSKELFGTTDDDSDTDIPAKVSSGSLKSKRKKESSSSRHEKKSNKESSKSKKRKRNDVEILQVPTSQTVDDISIRNLMNENIDDILATYPDHETHLTDLYEEHVKNQKISYKPVDVPDMTALDIVSSEQFGFMVNFLEKKLVRDAEKEPHYSDIIFDSLMPEWALGIFCNKHQCSRLDALERLNLQLIAACNRSH